MPYIVACKSVVYLLALLFLPRAEASLDNACILDKFRTATDETTVAEIRQSCTIETVGTQAASNAVPGVVEERIATEKNPGRAVVGRYPTQIKLLPRSNQKQQF